MTRYNDLRQMREAKFAAAKTTAQNPIANAMKSNETPVTKIEVTKPFTVTKIDIVTKLDAVTKIPVTKIGRGRPRLGDKPMTAAERMRRYRQRLRATTASSL
jgi:hypothetical protein